VSGVYPTDEAAITAGYEKFGLSAVFLVKLISEIEHPKYFSRNIRWGLISPLLLVHQRQALPACNSCEIACRDPFHLCAMSGFLVTGIAQNHAILVESM
jgi:hypothetical protein